MDIQVIDFTDCGLLKKNDEDVKEGAYYETGTRLFNAFSGIGIAYLKNSGIPRDIVEEMNEFSKIFFSMPYVDKMTLSNQDNFNMHYDPEGALRVSKERPHDKIEGLRVHSHDKSLWPYYPEMETRVHYFKDLCKRLTLRILMALGRGMKLEDKDHLSKSHQLLNEKGSHSSLKFSFYPAIFEDIDVKQLRIGEHKDFGSLTMIFFEDPCGLQVQRSNGEYENVQTVHDGILLILGQQMEFWTSGRLKAAYHRVIIPDERALRSKARYSICYFAAVDDKVILGVEESDDTNEDSQRYKKQITAGSFWTKLFDKAFYTDVQ